MVAPMAAVNEFTGPYNAARYPRKINRSPTDNVPFNPLNAPRVTKVAEAMPVMSTDIWLYVMDTLLATIKALLNSCACIFNF